MGNAIAAPSPDWASTLCLGCMEPKQTPGVCPRCGWSPEAGAVSILHLPPGTRLHNCYLIGRVLGQGGFGITYMGWDTQLRRKVAIKEFFPQVIASRQPRSTTVAPSTANLQADFDYGLRSFLNEGRILARFNDHPCIVSVLNLVEENSTGYLIMGYLDGNTLAQALAKAGGKLPYPTAREVMMRVMDGLREVHAQGLLHRDISPDNIYLTRQGLVKILDFGAARFDAGEQSQSLSVVLKEGYAPEEQYRRNGNQGPWTDVYATAATLYRSITGMVPPPALDRLHADSLEPISRLGVAIPPPAEAALLRALSVRAGDRFQSVESFQEALIPARELTHPVTEPEPLPLPRPDPLPPQPVPPPPKFNDAKWIWLAIGLLILFICAVLAYNHSRTNARREAQRIEDERQQEAESKRRADEAAEAQRKQQEADASQREAQAVAHAETVSDQYETWLVQRQKEMAPHVITVTLTNKCSKGAIRVAMRFKVPDTTDHWMTSGWWKVDSNTSLKPKVATANGNLYFFAENDAVIWDGRNESQPITVTIVSNNFVHVDGNSIEGKNQRTVTMFRKFYDSWGNHEVTFTCE
jgi:serine/threonine protein kinase